MKNKKGFTLVELLAVIVILALIMSIAVISIGGILDSTRHSTFKETGVSIINGVRQQLTLANKVEAGYYLFTKDILEKGGDKSPFGGTLKIVTSISTDTGGNCAGGTKIGDYVCKLASAPSCAANKNSFVRVFENNDVFVYDICLTAGTGNKYIYSGTSSTAVTATNVGIEANLLDSNNNTMIK